jgi:hypothetical protein
MSLGKDTFGLTKTDYTTKVGRIIANHRANSKLIGEPAEFLLRSCRLTERWAKLASDSEVVVYLRSIDIAGGRKVKMISLERGGTRQPVPKQKLIDELYPVKRISTSATSEEKHYNSVKAAMRRAVHYQLKEYRNGVVLPTICHLSGMKIRLGMKTDVDHVGTTFSEIADIFMQQKEMNYTDITLKGPPTAKVFKDGVLWQEWIAFHETNARFSLALSSANRSKGCEGYTTPTDLYGSFDKEDPEDLSLDF